MTVLVCANPAWADTIPDWLRQKIAAEQEIEAMTRLMGKDIREGMATDAEVLVCLYTAGLSAPLRYQHVQIYLYLGTKLCEARGTVIPPDVHVPSLTPDEEAELREMKRRIYAKRGPAETMISKACKEVFFNGKRPRIKPDTQPPAPPAPPAGQQPLGATPPEILPARPAARPLPPATRQISLEELFSPAEAS